MTMVKIWARYSPEGFTSEKFEAEMEFLRGHELATIAKKIPMFDGETGGYNALVFYVECHISAASTIVEYLVEANHEVFMVW